MPNLENTPDISTSFYASLTKKCSKEKKSSKFQRIIPFNLPLRPPSDRTITTQYQAVEAEKSTTKAKCSIVKSSNADGKRPAWRIYQANEGGAYVHHLLASPGQRVADGNYLPPLKYQPDGISAAKVIQLLVCEPTQQDAAIARVLIGIHERGQISLMAMPSVGVSYQLCQHLSGLSEPQNPQHYQQPANPNGHVYQFAFNAGHDRRARACLLLCCDSEAELTRLACFIEGIKQLYSFDASMLELVQRVMRHAEKQIIGCRIDRELRRELHEKSGGIRIHDHERPLPIKVNLGYTSVKIKAQEVKYYWRPQRYPTVKTRIFSGYANLTADLVSEEGLVRYPPKNLLNYPEKLPDIFTWVLLKQIDKLEHELKNNPMLMFTMDFDGLIPIEIAIDVLRDKDIGELFIKHWLQLPRHQQWCRNVFYEAMNSLSNYESNPFIEFDAKTRKKKLIAYLKKWQDGQSQVLPAVLTNTLNNYNNVQAHFWDSLISQCRPDNQAAINDLVCATIPERQLIFQAFLMDDWKLMQKALQDDFPDDNGLLSAVLSGDKEEVAFYIKEPGVSNDPDMKAILENLERWYAHKKKIDKCKEALAELAKQPPPNDVKAEYNRLKDLELRYIKLKDAIARLTRQPSENDLEMEFKRLNVLLIQYNKHAEATTVLDNPQARNDIEEEFEKLKNKLFKYNNKKADLLEEFNTYYSKWNSGMPHALKDLPIDYSYIRNLKKKCRQLMSKANEEQQKEIVFSLIADEIKFFYKLYHALKSRNIVGIIRFVASVNDPQHKWRGIQISHLYSTEKTPDKLEEQIEHDLKYYFEDGAVMPQEFELFIAACNKNHIETHTIAENQLNKLTESITSEMRNARQDANNRKRPELHQQIVQGNMPQNISAMKNEHIKFKGFHERLQNLSRGHVVKLINLLKEEINLSDEYQLMAIIPGSRWPLILRPKMRLKSEVFNIIIDQVSLDKSMEDIDRYLSYLNNAKIKLNDVKNPPTDVSIPLTKIREIVDNIYKLHQTFVNAVKKEIMESHSIFQIDELTYDIYGHALAWQCLANEFKNEEPSFSVEQSMDVVENRVQSLEKSQRQAFKSLSKTHASCHNAVMSLIRSKMLSFEAQDRWGANPLVLAVAANHVEIVQAFLKNKLFYNIYVNQHHHNSYYKLLPYATTKEMVETLLHFSINNNQGFFSAVGKDAEALYRQLAYHYPELADDSGLSLFEQLLLSGESRDLALFEKILPFEQKRIPRGPYDPNVPEKNRELLTHYYNDKEKRKQKNTKLPKAISTHFRAYKNANATLILKKHNANERKSELVSVHFFKNSNLPCELAETFLEICAECYGIKPTGPQHQNTSFLIKKSLDPKQNFNVAIITDSNGIMSGFLFYKIVRLDNHKQKPINIYYGGMAACKSSKRNEGSASLTFISALLAKIQADREDVNLYFYGRFNRPGVSYLLIPETAKVSTKYYYPPELIKKIAGAFDNEITERGTSKSPVVTKVTISKTGSMFKNEREIKIPQLLEYSYLLESLKAAPDEDLPLIFKIDTACFQDWLAKLNEKYDLNMKLLNELDEHMQSNNIRQPRARL